MNTNEIRALIQKHWGDAVLTAIDAEPALQMSFDEFLDHCTACGGNWEGMLLSGLKELRPKVWTAIPDEMGAFSRVLICETIELCGVFPSDKK
jgi:hypothetical protein